MNREIKTVTVTGGFGYVGSRLTPYLLDKGYKVKVIDLALYGTFGFDALTPKQKESCTWIKGDIRDPEAVEVALKGADAVIHLAAISNDPTGDLNETLTRQVNFDAVGLLLCKAKELGIARFINASSSSVFGIKSESNITEGLEPEPLTFYSKYKMLSEWIVCAASSTDFCTVNIRPATICGPSPRQRFDLTVNKLTADAYQKKQITVHGGQQRRPNIGMSDAVALYEQLLRVDAKLINRQTFNFGFENLKVIEIAELIKNKLSDLKPEISVTNSFDNRDYHIGSDKILNILKYKTVSSIANEVAELRKCFEGGKYKDVDAPEYYNMKVMKLDLSPLAYRFLGK